MPAMHSDKANRSTQHTQPGVCDACPTPFQPDCMPPSLVHQDVQLAVLLLHPGHHVPVQRWQAAGRLRGGGSMRGAAKSIPQSLWPQLQTNPNPLISRAATLPVWAAKWQTRTALTGSPAG